MYYRGRYSRSYIRSDWYIFAKLYAAKPSPNKDKK